MTLAAMLLVAEGHKLSGDKKIKFDPTQDKKMFSEIDNELEQA